MRGILLRSATQAKWHNERTALIYASVECVPLLRRRRGFPRECEGGTAIGETREEGGTPVGETREEGGN